MTTVLFPGSFDPFTDGHEAVVRRILPLFDRVVIAVGVNSDKRCTFSPPDRVARIRARFAACDKVEVLSYEGMTVDLCHQVGAQAIVRGIRGAEDIEYERLIATVNRRLDPAIETLFVLADDEHRNISSTLEREKMLHPSHS